MTICIDLTSVSYHMTGIERYALCITEKLLEQDDVNSYIIVCRNEIPRIIYNFINDIRIKAIVLKGKHKLIFNQIILPIAINKIKADRYLFLAFTSPMLVSKRPLYNTIHDMGIWDCRETVTVKQRIYFKTVISISAKCSEKLLTVSEFSKERISSILGIDSSKIEVVPSAIASELTREEVISFQEVVKKFSLPDKYIMSLSTLEPRKNLNFLLKAFSEVLEQVDYDLVLVGREGWKIGTVIENMKLQKRVHLLGFVEDKYISSLYMNALCFVFPSLYEGFGLPPLEALYFGTPVISSDAASMPEILQNQVTYFKCTDLNQLKQLLKNLERDRTEMPKGLNAYQSDNFTFKKSAMKILKLLEFN